MLVLREEWPMKIMVVDDEKDVELLFRQSFRKEIRERDVEFHFAVSGDDAISYVEGDSGDDLVLVLSDINMPGMNGLELLRQIKECRPGQEVFMVTAYGDAEKYDAAMKYGAGDYIMKPIDFGDLKRKIRKLKKVAS